MKQFSLYTNPITSQTQDEKVFTISADSLEVAILMFAKRKNLSVEDLLEIFTVKESE